MITLEAYHSLLKQWGNSSEPTICCLSHATALRGGDVVDCEVELIQTQPEALNWQVADREFLCVVFC